MTGNQATAGSVGRMSLFLRSHITTLIGVGQQYNAPTGGDEDTKGGSCILRSSQIATTTSAAYRHIVPVV